MKRGRGRKEMEGIEATQRNENARKDDRINTLVNHSVLVLEGKKYT